MAKYDACRDHLERSRPSLQLTFAEVASLVPGGLPASAYRRRA